MQQERSERRVGQQEILRWFERLERDISGVKDSVDKTNEDHEKRLLELEKLNFNGWQGKIDNVDSKAESLEKKVDDQGSLLRWTFGVLLMIGLSMIGFLWRLHVTEVQEHEQLIELIEEHIEERLEASR